MENVFYLLNISVSGIKNIQKEVRLNFYKKTVDKDFNPEKYRVKAIYGENGSGKSALITSVKIFQDLILNDNYLSETKTQKFLDEIINKTSQVFYFNCEFLFNAGDDKFIFNYTVKIGKNENGRYEIQQESLYVKNGNYSNNKYNMIFENKQGELVSVSCADSKKEEIEKKTANLLAKSSFIGLYVIKFGLMDLYENIFCYYLVVCIVFVLSIRVYIEDEDQHELYFEQSMLNGQEMDNHILSDVIFKNKENNNIFLSVNNKIIYKKDFQKYKEKVSQLTEFIKIFKPNLQTIEIDAKENGEQYICDLNMNYVGYVINKEFESTGIKKLIRLFDCFMAASVGRIVFIDEMDSNLNDVYLCKLIEYFMYYSEGQLCFTTHNLDPMMILKENKNSIDFLSSDNHLVSWVSRGNASPENCYRNGMIEDSPFNIDATDFVGILGE